MSDFGGHSNPKAAKNYRCEWCGQEIPKGEVHFKWDGKWDGEFQSWRMHKECHEIADLNNEITEGFTPFGNERPAAELAQEVGHGNV